MLDTNDASLVCSNLKFIPHNLTKACLTFLTLMLSKFPLGCLFYHIIVLLMCVSIF